MRITNKMMTNNSMNNINKNKVRLNTLDEQYSTGKKIQRPSDDPIIAVRALKLRTNVSEISQYYKKNIPDAMSWMEVTESALKNVNTVLTDIHTQCTQGSTDTLSKSDRESIIKNLEQMKTQIYQEGDTNYAGRYVFTGFKTNTSLTFKEASLTTPYKITETFAGEDIETISKVSGQYSVSQYNPASPDPTVFASAPSVQESYKLRLSYDNLDSTALDPTKLTYMDTSVTPAVQRQFTDAPLSAVVEMISVNDPTAYSPADDPAAVPPATNVHYIPETGELILSKNAYNYLRTQGNGAISVEYSKTNFTKGDLRPEHYFDCTTTNPAVTYTKATQNIEYEITFNQKIAINTEGKDAISHGIGRDINEISAAVKDVTSTEDKIVEVDKLLTNPGTTDAQKEALNKLKSQLNTELVLKNDILQTKFASGISSSEKYQSMVNESIADAGSRYVRLELTESRLDTQLVDTTELMSNNEDADIAEVMINYTSAQNIYNASLNAASKIVKNTLLDFI